MNITLYPEMNEKIKDLLRLENNNICLYAAEYIEWLEKQLEQYRTKENEGESR